MNNQKSSVGNRRRVLAVTGVAIAAGVTGVAVAWRHQDVGAAGQQPAAAAFLRQSFQTPSGTILALDLLKGQPLLVNFWAAWCAPCVEELPMLDAFYTQQRTQGWQLIGLAADQPTAVRRFLEATPVSFPVALAGLAGIQLSKALGNESGGLPFSVLFDRTGRIQQRKLGQLSRSELDSWARMLS